MENAENKAVETENTDTEKPKDTEKSDTAKVEGAKKDKKTEKKLKSDLAAAEAEIKRLSEELEAEKDRGLRTLAEYDNFRRRSQKEKEALYADAMCDAVKEILPLLDNLERAGQFTDGEKVAEGLAMMAKMSDAMLEKLGVSRFGAKGDPFDPAWHNAVMHIDDESFGENEITDVFEVGYKRGDKVIRFAMVRVAN